MSIAHFGHAQILRVDKGDLTADSSNYLMGSINLDFNLNNKSATAEQSITYTGLVANGDLVYVGREHAYILINQLNYFKTTGGPLFSTGNAHFRVNFLRKRKVSYETFVQVQYDQGRNMPFRMLEGAGVRFRLSKKEKSDVFMGMGAMYERETWKSLEDEDMRIEKDMLKSANYISYKQRVNNNVDFNLIAYYQVGYDQEDDLVRNRVSGQAVMNVKLTDVLAFNTSFAVQYEDHPIIPINGFVYSLTNGLKWSF